MIRSHTTVSTTCIAALRRWIGRVLGTGAASLDALELRGMSDHELKDLGIGRSEVQEWSRRRAPTDRRGTPERADLSPAFDERRDRARPATEHRRHDRLEAPSLDVRRRARSMQRQRCSTGWTPALRP